MYASFPALILIISIHNLIIQPLQKKVFLGTVYKLVATSLRLNED